MPKAYEQIRDKFLRLGASEKEAKAHAAAIYNSKIAPKTHQPFVTGKQPSEKGGKK